MQSADLRIKRAQADINEALGVKPQPPAQNPDIGYGRREDGSNKGRGFYGMLPRTDGPDQSSELSIGVEMDGKQRTIPSMVPGLNAEQLRYLLSVQKPIRPDITQKAVDFAVQRQQQGNGPFAEPNEEGAYRVPRYAQGGTVRAKKKTPSDYITDAIASGLAVLPAYRGNEKAAYQKALSVTDILDWTPAGIPEALYQAGDMLGRGVRDRSALGTAGGLGMAAIAGLPLPGKKAIKNAVKKGADLAVSGLKDIRPPSDDAWSVIRSNFDAGRVVGDETVPLDKLSYGVSVGEQPQRVKDLAAKISGPDGYFSRPIVDQAGNVLEGQHRVSALASLGVKDIPVRRVQDLFDGIDRAKLVDAIKGAGKVAPEHANQIASHIAEMAADAGGAAKVAQEFDLRGPFEKHFLAGLKAIDQPAPARSLMVKELAPPPALAVEPPKGIRAYHGSPHAFDKFDLSKIGTGEGAQSYGHGLYFAENEGVAKGYRDTLSGETFLTPSGELFDPTRDLKHVNTRATFTNALRKPETFGADPVVAALSRAQQIGKENPTYDLAQSDIARLMALRERGGIQGNPGHMYEVNINADPAQFLDWDAPLSAQPHITEALVDSFRVPSMERRHMEQWRAPKWSDHAPDTKYMDAVKAGTKYQALAGDLGAWDKASAALMERGVPGIKYLDQGSRLSGDADRLVANYGTREKALEVAQKRLEASQRTFGAQKDRAAWEKLALELAAPRTNNFVVFKPELVDILKRYAVPVAGAGTAASALAVKAKQPQEEDY